MKAVVLTKNAKLEIQNLEEEKLNPTGCRVKISYAGICSSDIGRAFSGGAYSYPLVMGHEITGKLIKVGSKVAKLKVGDRVAVFPLLPCFACPSCKQEKYALCVDYSYFGSRRNGGFCESLVVPEWNLLKLPKSVDDQDAVAVEPMAVVVHALKKANIFHAPPAKMAIIGGGFLGLLASSIVNKKCPKTEVVVIDRNQFKLDLIKGKVKTLLLKSEADWNKYITTTNPAFEVVIEATGNPDSFLHTIELTTQSGTVVWMGNISGDLTIPQKVVSSVLRKELTVMGTWNSLYRPGKKDDWKDAIKLMQEGIKPSVFVSHRIALEEVPEVLEKLYRHKSRQKPFPSVKVVVDLAQIK